MTLGKRGPWEKAGRGCSNNLATLLGVMFRKKDGAAGAWSSSIRCPGGGGGNRRNRSSSRGSSGSSKKK